MGDEHPQHGRASLFRLRLVLAALRPSSPLHFRQPLRRPAASLALPDCQAFQYDDRFGYLISLGAQIRQHLVDVHFKSVPCEGRVCQDLFYVCMSGG